MSDTTHKGGCAYGKIRVEGRGEPYRVGVCHCLTCRRLHGAPYSFYAVADADAIGLSPRLDPDLTAGAAAFVDAV